MVLTLLSVVHLVFPVKITLIYRFGAEGILNLSGKRLRMSFHTHTTFIGTEIKIFIIHAVYMYVTVF